METARRWFERISDQIDRDGYRTTDWHQWSTWPFSDTPPVRAIDPPSGDEPQRRGAGGQDCRSCAIAAMPGDSPEVVWHDEVAMLTAPEATSLPFAAFLSPRRHADLGGLTDLEAGHLGVLCTRIERAACEVLDVPRVQVLRWGDGGEHLHWWLLARPTGILQLRGTFLALWDDILPARDPIHVMQDLKLVADRL